MGERRRGMKRDKISLQEIAVFRNLCFLNYQERTKTEMKSRNPWGIKLNREELLCTEKNC